MDRFFQSQRGSCLIVGNGPSLNDIPDAFLRKYPSFGCNLIFLRQTFAPTFYVTVDRWVVDGFGGEILSRFMAIPKFVPRPELDDWGGASVYRFLHNPGELSLLERDLRPDFMRETGIAWRGVTHAMLQLAFFMGFDRFYLVGCDNTPDAKHFYGEEVNDHEVDRDLWEWGFDTLQVSFLPKPIVNLSTRGEISCLPRGDWRQLAEQERL